MGSLLFDPRSGRCLIGLLGRSFGFLPYSEFTFLLDCFDAASAGVGDLACFYIVALVAKSLMKYFYFLECGDTVGSLFCRFWPELGPFRAKSCGSSEGALIL